MSKEKLPWGKFYWNDWRGDPRLKACGYAARGLWIEMLCIMAESDPTGYLTVGRTSIDLATLARLTGGMESEANSLLNELERNGVFSRDKQGRIYSRRMTDDDKKSKTARKNGKNGGNPSLGKQKGNPALDNHQDKPEDKGGLKPQRPETRDQKEKRKTGPPSGDLDPRRIVYQGTVLQVNLALWDKIAFENGLNDQQLTALFDERDKFLAKLSEGDNRRQFWYQPTINWLQNQLEGVKKSQ